MGDLRGFLKIARQGGEYRPVCERLKDYDQVSRMRSDEQSSDQAARCMDCQTPFCHGACPIGNYIPEWNDHMFRGRWAGAVELLEATNNLPEITGRVCPALCEYACVLGINSDAVTIRENELSVIEYGFKNGLIKPRKPKLKTGKSAAIIGSGPSGLACAAQLNRAGHTVTVYERDAKPGGIMRYGIPDFKLEKSVIDRRLDIWRKEGIEFKTGVNVGVDIPALKIVSDYDAIVLAGGSRAPRDINLPGRDLKGIYFAMDYLSQSNRIVAGETIPRGITISAKGKKVVVIGGGDTGSDCVGTANRQGAACVTQIEVMPKPSECRGAECPWPRYPMLLKTTSSHEEGAGRYWSVETRAFIGEKGEVRKLSCVSGSKEFEIEADMVIIAAGFLHPERAGLIDSLKVKLDGRGNVATDDKYMTSLKKVFCAGDMRRGQSLVVWAVSEGRRCAFSVDRYLTGESSLPII